jgi:mono/diheme cytochrome c family protein
MPRFSFLFLVSLAVAGRVPAADAPLEFNRDVRQILSDNCFACHGPDARKMKAGLRFDREASAKAAAKSGAVPIVPHDSKKSELIARITATDDTHMPPAESGKKLTPEQIATLRKWIDQGAKWEDHWAFTPIKRPVPPPVKGSQFLKNPIDRFVAVKLKEQGLTPAAPADRVTLIRRLSFDLTGLPPTSQEVQDFLNDREPEAYEKLVDRLLKSPHYGERLAMFWLDLARYADSVGYHGDQPVSVWPYRDYVIRSFNANMPFDRFTIEQLAGDLLPNPTQDQKIASGYNRLGMMSAEGGVQPKEYLAKYIAERVRGIGGAWLGLTTGCAECHDHKFDPISTKDFYRFEAFFADIQEQGLYNGNNFGSSMAIGTPVQQAKLDELTKAVDEAKAKLAESTEKTAALKKAVADAEKARADFQKSIPTTLITVAVKPRPIRVLARGNWMDDKGELVEPGTPSWLPQLPEKGERLTRLDLAQWLVARENPLTARVLANRLWKLFHGAGLARKLDDVGSQGEAPTHPELLDYLAGKLIDNGWDLKGFIKLLVTSETYQRSSVTDAATREKDPFNLWLARQGRWRLDAELIRDNALAVSGLLNTTQGGPSVKPYQPGGYWSFLNFPKREWQNDSGDNLYRRGVYTHWQRQYLHPTLMAFDAPSREECTADRVRSNTPLQSLVLLNAPEFVEAARVFAEDVLAQAKPDPTDRLGYAFRKALSRAPKPAEIEVLLSLLQRMEKQYQQDEKAAQELIAIGARPGNAKVKPAELAAWTQVMRTILNLHSVVTRN